MLTETLRRLHNLALSCYTIEELQDNILLLSTSTPLEYFDLLHSTSLAGPSTVLPIYYLHPSKATGKRQDRHGNFYQPN